MRTLILISCALFLVTAVHARGVVGKTARGVGDATRATARTTKTIVRKTGNGASDAGRITLHGADKTRDGAVAGTKGAGKFFRGIGKGVGKAFKAVIP